MTRGGPRKGAGRPKTEGETRSSNLCGVRVTPTLFAACKAAAAVYDESLSEWVNYWLRFGIEEARQYAEKSEDDRDRYVTEQVAALAEKLGLEKPKKRKGKKS